MVRKTVLGVLRAGPNSIHRAWAADVSQHVDLAVSSFGGSEFERSCFKHVHAFDGSKMHGIKRFFDENPRLLDEYDHVWLIEDDLFIPPNSAKLVVQVARTDTFALFQPALSLDSHTSFGLLVQNPGFLLRVVDFVEQMAPVFRSDLLRRSLPHFDDNYSGFGYEWLWQRYVEEDGGFSAVIDCAPVYHTRPVGRGDLVANAPADGSRSDDLKLFMEKHALRQRTLIYAGLTLSGGGKSPEESQIVTGTALVEAQVAGLRQLLELDHVRYMNLVGGVTSSVAWGSYLLDDVVGRTAAARARAAQFRSRYLELFGI